MNHTRDARPGPTPRVLVDASNLRVGGIVQVGASLIDELTELRRDDDVAGRHPWLRQVVFHVSPQVHANLTVDKDAREKSVTGRPWWHPALWLRPRKDFDLQLVIFGPRYGWKRAPKTLVGIADVTSVYDWPRGVPPGPLQARLKRTVRTKVARWLFARESFLVSESAALIDAFQARVGFDPRRTAVVPNTVNRAVVDPALRAELQQDLRSGLPPGAVLLAYPARLYPHKNHALLPLVRERLEQRGVEARFVVTLTETEWQSMPERFRDACVNVGIVPVNVMAGIYQQSDAVFFPSLLESFSATPIEGLLLNGIVFASDRGFVRDVCGDRAVYFDPLDPDDAAEVLARVLCDDAAVARLRKRAEEIGDELITPRDRALEFVRLASALLATGP